MGTSRRKDPSPAAAELRRKAEAMLAAKPPGSAPPPANAPENRILHELQVHQIELEMQNSELRQARDQVESNLEIYTDLFDFAPVGYLTLDREGVVQAANLAIAALLGIDRSRLFRRSFERFVAGEDRPAFAGFLERMFSERERAACELALETEGGSRFFAQLGGIVLEPGAECHVAVTDITERRRIEEALRDSEKLYRAIGESIDFGVWVCAPDGRNLYASESFLRLVGITQEQCSDFGWGELLHPDDAERTIAAWKECVRTEGVWDIEHRFRGVDGRWHPILARGVPVRNAGGEIIYWAGINLDIGRMKEAEEALVRQTTALEAARVQEGNGRRRLAAVMEALPVGVAIVDSRGGDVETNSAFERIWAGPRPPVKAVDDYAPYLAWWADTGKPVAPREWASAIAIETGRSTTGQLLRIRRFDGSEAMVMNSASPIRDLDGNLVGAVVAVQDVSQLWRAEEGLRKAHAELEAKVLERTEELTKVNLRMHEEIGIRRRAEASLQNAYAEIKQLKDRLQAENLYLQHEVAQEYNFGEIVGRRNALSQVFLRVEQVAPMNATVLLLGETGTGKGVIARAIHGSSARKDQPMITVSCMALPANLIESELFGREKGAFTGASARQIGRFELADGGTIFLDEIGEMPLEMQSKLLRVIQDGEFERLGNPRSIKVDVRIIAATNRNLEEEIRKGRFREDLYYRLNVFPIHIPPLRQRKEDIPLLVEHFVAKFNKKIGKRIGSVSSATLEALTEYHWPGNVRELESVIERAVITSPGAVLEVLDRFDTFRKPEEAIAREERPLVEMEREHVLSVLRKTGWKIEGKRGAAAILGLNPSTLRARMRKYGIRRETVPDR